MVKKTEVEPTKDPVVKKTTDAQKTKKRRRRRPNKGGTMKFQRYIQSVLKEVHPNQGISVKAMAVMNDMMVDLVHKIGAEAKNARKITGTTTLMPQMIQTGVKLLLPGELRKHGVAEGTRALDNYQRATKEAKDPLFGDGP
mmetsp:Transcript_25562/g.38020  ORF Transcript_25562/g.38020 Transcript_25562/m.38020 type:complete len:141 (-) Transcript_25562:295-717(-)